MYGRIKQIQWNIVELPGLTTYGSHCPFSLKRQRKGVVTGIGEEWASLVLQVVRNPPAVQETWVWSLGQEDPLVKEMATHSSILAWEIPWTEEPGGPQSTGLQKSQTWLGDWTPPPPTIDQQLTWTEALQAPLSMGFFTTEPAGMPIYLDWMV